MNWARAGLLGDWNVVNSQALDSLVKQSYKDAAGKPLSNEAVLFTVDPLAGSYSNQKNFLAECNLDWVSQDGVASVCRKHLALN